MYISKEMRLVILLPVMGEKLLLTIPENIIYLVAIRLSCTRQSSSASISKVMKSSELHWTNVSFLSCIFIFLQILTVTSTPVAVIDSMKVSQMGSISFPIYKCALSAWLSFFISIPLLILSAFSSLLFFCNNLCILKIYCMSCFMLMKSNSIVLLWSF